jgi:hypothetical protein
VCACVSIISHATHKTKQTGVNSSKLEHITLYNNPERLHVPSPLRLLAAFMIPRYTESVCALVCTVTPIRALLTHTRRAVRAKELRRRVKEANIDSSDAIAPIIPYNVQRGGSYTFLSLVWKSYRSMRHSLSCELQFT